MASLLQLQPLSQAAAENETELHRKVDKLDLNRLLLIVTLKHLKIELTPTLILY